MLRPLDRPRERSQLQAIMENLVLLENKQSATLGTQRRRCVCVRRKRWLNTDVTGGHAAVVQFD